MPTLCPEIGTLAPAVRRRGGEVTARCPACGADAPVFGTSEGPHVWRFRRHPHGGDDATTR